MNNFTWKDPLNQNFPWSQKIIYTCLDSQSFCFSEFDKKNAGAPQQHNSSKNKEKITPARNFPAIFCDISPLDNILFAEKLGDFLLLDLVGGANLKFFSMFSNHFRIMLYTITQCTVKKFPSRPWCPLAVDYWTLPTHIYRDIIYMYHSPFISSSNMKRDNNFVCFFVVLY